MNQTNSYLTEEKVGKLILKFSIPCIMSLLVASLYNIVDQIFIGRGIGYLGNGATNVVFPITIVALAIALLIGDGCAAHLSICQGKKDAKGSSKGVGNAISVILVAAIIYTVLLLFAKETLLQVFGATENNYAYAVEYYQVIAIGIPFFMIANGLNSVIRADGNPKFAMISTLIGAIINVILDPIAIFVLGWGMQGAALATIVGQIVSACLAIYYLTNPKSFHLTKSDFIVKAEVLKKVLPLGISSFITQISIVVIMAVMNNMLVMYGANSKYGADIPLTVVGLVMKVFQIVIAFVVGVAAGSQPIVGYNYGAGKLERVKEIYRTIIKVECIIGLISMLLVEFFPRQIISIFGSESELYNEYAVLAFRIYLFTILLCCIQKATSIFLQSIGKSGMSMTLSLLRDIVIVVPAAIIFATQQGVTGILYSAPVADVLSMFFVVFMMKRVFKELSVSQVNHEEVKKNRTFNKVAAEIDV
ncbi:MAG: MATE family efflux transporter [Lachnospiraceae bacterium]